jgi:D-threonate/D-erythronate kinase
LRGPLGAELDAAMEAAGADMALVLPAIPEAGRATVGGRQLVDGVPVHETAFARDPQNPVTDCRVAAVIAATSRRRVASAGLDEIRHDGVEGVLARWRGEGATIVVGDAQTDDDLRRWLRDLEAWKTAMPRAFGRRSLVVAGSTGVARAIHPYGAPSKRWREAPVAPPANRAATALVVVGSAHPAAAAQLAYAERGGLLHVVRVGLDAPSAAGAEARGAMRQGHHVALATATEAADGGSERTLAAMAEAARVAVERTLPRALVLVGGETAFATLSALGDPPLWIERSPAPLAVAAIALDGPLAGTPVVTKGGSSGPPERLAALLEDATV